ncbi:MAG: hypothetical protein GX144_13725 [Clostridiaceae bacterium]|nr:hypothetical protein [Clostridiaceae bacterium]
MLRGLQRIKVIAAFGAFLCAATSFFFISYTDLNVIIIVNSSLLVVFTIAVILHGVILPDRDVRRDEKTVKAHHILSSLAMIFTREKVSSSNLLNDDLEVKIFSRSWNPKSMFTMLVLCLITYVPAISISINRYYELCMLGFGFFFMVLFVLSFAYLYYHREENGDDKSRKSAKGTIWAMVMILLIGGGAYIMERVNNDPINKIKRSVAQWEATKKRLDKLKDDYPPVGGIITDFTKEELSEIIAALQQEYGNEMLYRIIDEESTKRDDKNHDYRELTLVVAVNEDVYVYLYRKYPTNDENGKGQVVLYTCFKSETLERDAVFPEDTVMPSE